MAEHFGSRTFATGELLAGPSAHDAVAFANAIDISVHDRIESVESEWLAAEKASPISVYQRYQWAATFLECGNSGNGQPFIVLGRINGETVFILPLVIRGRFVRELSFVGGSHVNFNMGLFPDKYNAMMTAESMERILERIAGLVPGVGYMSLCCQPENWRGTRNPMTKIRCQRSANPAFVLDLSGGFDAALGTGNEKRKRKKFRQQQRLAEQMGGHEFVKPRSAAEIEEVLAAFYDQKSKRLKSLGIRNVFGCEQTRLFLLQLALRSTDMAEPLLQLYALRVGGRIAGVFGGGVLSGRLSGYFSSIETDAFSALSPGEMLLYLIVEDACRAGYSQIDLGAGDERYKRSWSSATIAMYDTILPLSRSGRPLVAARLALGAARRYGRETPVIWETYKRLRKLRGALPGWQ